MQRSRSPVKPRVGWGALTFVRLLTASVVAAAALTVIATAPSGALAASPDLNAGQSLTPGQMLVAPGGGYFAVLQSDGNFVVYTAQNHPIWASGTSGGTLLVAQGDGNIVLYAGGPGSYRPIWATGTSSIGPVSLVMQTDGNLVVYNAIQPLWASKSGHIPILPRAIGVNQPFYSPSGQYEAIFQGDGNFVVYRLSATPQAIWSSGTGGQGANQMLLQGDGNVVIYAGSRPVWSTGTSSPWVLNLVMQNDGNLVLYSGARPLWASGTDIGYEVAMMSQMELGYTENPPHSNCNAFTAYFGRGSSTGNGGVPCAPGTAAESWCSDYANWVWLNAGAGVTGITGWSFTYVRWGIVHGTFKQGATNDPQPGDAVVWGDMSQSYGSHVGTVVAVRADGWINVVSGNDGNDSVGISGFFNPVGDTIDGYPIVGYTSPLAAGIAAIEGGASVLGPTPTQAQINTQD